MCEDRNKSRSRIHQDPYRLSTAGATFEDVKLMYDHVGEGAKVKSSGWNQPYLTTLRNS